LAVRALARGARAGTAEDEACGVLLPEPEPLAVTAGVRAKYEMERIELLEPVRDGPRGRRCGEETRGVVGLVPPGVLEEEEAPAVASDAKAEA
jgi:hypothetical protein